MRDFTGRSRLRSAFVCSVLSLPLLVAEAAGQTRSPAQGRSESPAASRAAPAPGKRALTHEDYDGFPRLRNTVFSRNGEWMAYVVAPTVGDGVLHVVAVAGDVHHEFPRGASLTFANDNRHAFFRVEGSKVEERRRKLEKLYAAEEQSEEELTEEQKKTAAAAEKAAKKAEKAAEEARKELANQLHVLDLRTGEVQRIDQVKRFGQPEVGDLLVLHMEAPKKSDDAKEAGDAKESGAGESKPGAGEAGETTGAAAAAPAGAAQPGATAAAQQPTAQPLEVTPAAPTEPTEPTEPSAAVAAGEATAPAPEPGKPAGKPAAKDPLEKHRKDGTRLVLRSLADGSEVAIEHVLGYGFLRDGAWMWYTVGTKKVTEGVQHGLFARELATGRTVTLLDGYSNVSGVRADREDTRVAFASDLQSFGEEDAPSAVYLWEFTDAPARCIVTAATRGVPEGFLVDDSGLGFSDDGSVVTFGVKPKKRDELPKILPEDEVKLDLWNYRDGLLQTMQARRSDPAEAVRTAVYHLDADLAVVLGDAASPRASLITPDGSRALASDGSSYEQRVTWDGRYSDYYVINTLDGSRQRIITELRGSASASPTGRYVLWFDNRDYAWHVYDLDRGEARNLTGALDVAFDREDDDRPEPHSAHGSSGWTEGDREVLLHDEFDVWAVDPVTGAARCVTDGLGRATGTVLRVTRIDLRPDSERSDEDPDDRRWLPETLVLMATEQATYAKGYYVDSLHGVARPRRLLMTDRWITGVTRPDDADRLFMTFARFDEYPDVWTTGLDFAAPRKLTDVGAVLDLYRWGSAELVQWTSDDGKALKGVLVKPEGFDASRQYPMMVYFYERRSHTVHNFVFPDVGTSPNAAYYVSNGYLWFIPDIVYREGYPGESCEKCVVSGVQSLIAQGFVDRDAIGIAGHSWGGYQTAHLITRTHLFAAAESGAPVVDMYSAYGGIRWGTGMSRQFQYEKTQSRIGGSIWEYPMRYWENSPLFHLDKVTTPVLILHNDKDGAVPWYQGIEFFVAMRRLGKEAYLLNYNGEDHGLGKRQNQRDWTRRMQQFFDHHLRGARAPEWMEQGVPYHERVAEKIADAPSFREAVELGLIEAPGAAVAAEAAAPVDPSPAGPASAHRPESPPR